MSAPKKRIDDPLIEKAAEALENMSGIDGYFIQQNDMSADDCKAFMNRLAAILRGFNTAPPEIQYALLLTGMDTPDRLTEALWDSALFEWMKVHQEKSLALLAKSMKGIKG